jgi:hypothetical protein
MESKPLIVVTLSKPLSRNRTLKTIDSFVEKHEAEESKASGLLNRERVTVIPEDIIDKLKIMKSFMELEEISIAASSSAKIESGDLRLPKNSKKIAIIKTEKNATEKKRKIESLTEEVEVKKEKKVKKKKLSDS